MNTKPNANRRLARPPALVRALARVAILVVGLVGGLTGGCGGDDPLPKPPPKKAAPARPTTPRSLVLVDLSGVRYEEVAPVGDAVPATSLVPAFRALVQEGAFFTQAVASAAWDAPSIAGLFSGLSPDQCTVHGRPHEGVRGMIPAIETLAEMLVDGGYATAAFTAGGHVSRVSKLDQGFATWEEIPDDAQRLAAAARWMNGLEKDRPRFLFLHATAAAAGASAPATSRTARLAELDQWLRAVRALADAAKTKDDGWFMVVSDHGDVLSEREGGLDPGDTGTFDAQIHVPLAAVGPGFKQGLVDASVCLLDVVPTIRSLLGLERSSWVEGASFESILTGAPSSIRPCLSQGWRRVRTASGPTNEHVVAVRVPGAKFTSAFDTGTGTWTEQLFDLRSDPTEARPLPATATATATEPDTDRFVKNFGAEFARAVTLVRQALGRGQDLRNDPIAGPYFVRSSGGLATPTGMDAKDGGNDEPKK